MKYSYYPGCTLKNKAKDLDRYARLSAEVLGITLDEIPEWQCCGGAYTAAGDEIATKLPSVRALKAAEAEGQDLVTLCSACHNVIKRVRSDLVTNEAFAAKVNNYMADEVPFAGDAKVVHFLELLRDTVGFETLKAKVIHPFTGKKIAAYYGCLLLRPGKVLAMDDPENPKIMEDFIRAIGGEPVIYPYRNECCGAYITLEDKASALKKSGEIMASASGFGADYVITACPLCLYNLNAAACESAGVLYFTELLAMALGIDEKGRE